LADGWTAVDGRVRSAKRSLFAGARRGVKIARERMANAVTALQNLTAKRWRRVRNVPARVAQTAHRWDDTRKRLETYRAEWAIEREIARVVSGSGPIIVGPWLSEVGYEVLYWIPFVRWVQATYWVKPERMVVVSRGGAAAWYGDITPNTFEIFDLLSPEQFTTENADRAASTGGSLKQHAVTPMDQRIIDEVMRRRGWSDAAVLHPSLMYRLFQQFWLGHRPPSFLERRTRYRLITPPAVDLPDLPDDYVAVKFYTAASLPPSDENRRTLQSLVLALAERTNVVMLDTGLTLDDHDDYSFAAASRVHGLRGLLRPQDNLAVQSAIIARASAFVGTCGSVAWLAPMLGVNTTAVLADPKFLHGHLQVARRVYQVSRAAGFSPLYISALDQLGLRLAGQPRHAPFPVSPKAEGRQ
jgi:hypothetical protein